MYIKILNPTITVLQININKVASKSRKKKTISTVRFIMKPGPQNALTDVRLGHNHITI